MRTSSPPHHHFAAIVLSGCVVIASIGIGISLIHRRYQQEIQMRIAAIPETITLEKDTLRFSTSSATLITQESKNAYAPYASPLDSVVTALLPFSSRRPNPYDEKLVTVWVESLAPSINVPDSKPAIEKEKSGVRVSPGKLGSVLDAKTTVTTVLRTESSASGTIPLTISQIGKELTPDGIIQAEHRGTSLLGKTLIVKSQKITRVIKDTELFVLLDLPSGFSSSAVDDLANILEKEIGTPPTEPVLRIENKKVLEFHAPLDGIGLAKEKFATELADKITQLETQKSVDPLNLPVQKTAPKQQLSSLNTLGISERIGLGESAYSHSIPNRIHNVSHTTERIHAKLIMPGEEFSFNKYLGDVSAATGFKQAYVIKEGQTVLGDGGGVCQVSSTLFRALLNAGLPITERKGHSYRVGYYEQNSKPGFDATVYDPHPDLRFINDTDTAILINAVADAKNTSMYVELWGKSDGRKAEVKNYRQWDAQPAPPPRYQDDPTLRPGQLKQVDYAAPGLKTSFDYIVTYPDGQVKEKKFSTNYIPWAAVYLRGI